MPLNPSEELLRQVFASCPVGMSISRLSDRTFIDINAAFTRTLGWTRDDIVGRTTLDIALMDARVVEDLRAHMATSQKLENVEVEMRARDGGRRRILLSTEPVELHGEPHSISTFVDVTARKNAEIASNRIAAIVESSGDAIIGKDINGTITTWNGGAERIFGYTAAEAVGMPVLALIPLDRHDEEARILAKIRNGERVAPFDTRRVRKDGTTIDVSVTASPIRDDTGTIIGASKIARDISEQRRADLRLRRMMDSRLQGVMFTKTTGVVTHANDALLEILSFTRADLEAGMIDWRELTPPEYDEVTETALRELAQQGYCAPFEKEFMRKNGSRVSVLVGAAKIDDDSDDAVAFVLDLTERKKLERQIFRAQRMDSIGTLAGGIAHDLNNMLSPILMSIAMLREDTNDPEHRALLNTLEVSAVRASDLVQQVLSFARGVEGSRVPVKPAKIMRELLSVLRDTFPKSIAVRFPVPEELWSVNGDPTQLQQVFMNLCINARDAMPDGGELSVRMDNIRLDETYAAMNIDAHAGEYVKITVSDNGHGIPADVRDRIFEPFFTTKETGKGTGLGLSTTMAIIKSHGGFLSVYSEPGAGTAFNVYVPANSTHVAGGGAESETPRELRGQGQTVLVVDDEQAIRQVATLTLERFGYRVMTASNGAQAVGLYALNQETIAVILTDIAMPVMDGSSMITALRSINPDVRIVASSGLPSTARAALAGADHVAFIAKPYTADALLRMLDEALASP
jgi:PAS domain S-box-containing protein